MNKVLNKKKPVGLTAGKIILLSLLSLLFLFLAVAWIFLNVYKPTPIDETIDFPSINWEEDYNFENPGGMIVEEDMADEDHPESVAAGEAVALKKKDGVYTFLIIGRDALTRLLTDTMMLVTFDANENEIGILNVPRDSYINVAGHYSGRMNGVLAAGYNAAIRANKSGDEALVEGIKFLSQMIRVTFGIPVNYYMTMDLNGFKSIVTAVGGVEVDVPEDMHYEDPEQKLFVNLQKGRQTLNADKAEQFVRYRGYADADIGRIRAQKTFISALAKKMMKFDLAQIERLTDVINEHVVTNLSLVDAGWFATKALGMKLENIVLHTVPGEGFRVGKAACYTIYKPETIKIINEHYNPYTDDIPESNFNIYEGSRIYAAQADTVGTTMDKLAGN